jgi:putative ATP-grasp target RiPP
MDMATQVPFGLRAEQAVHSVVTPKLRLDPKRQVSVTPDGEMWALSAAAGTETATNNDSSPDSVPDPYYAPLF